ATVHNCLPERLRQILRCYNRIISAMMRLETICSVCVNGLAPQVILWCSWTIAIRAAVRAAPPLYGAVHHHWSRRNLIPVGCVRRTKGCFRSRRHGVVVITSQATWSLVLQGRKSSTMKRVMRKAVVSEH